jgi:lactobin A/cerein 7B family class IIb bacteriocin
MADEKKEDLVNVESLEISALDDKELESVSGGYTNANTVASCACCMATSTTGIDPPKL